MNSHQRRKRDRKNAREFRKKLSRVALIAFMKSLLKSKRHPRLDTVWYKYYVKEIAS